MASSRPRYLQVSPSLLRIRVVQRQVVHQINQILARLANHRIRGTTNDWFRSFLAPSPSASTGASPPAFPKDV